MASVVAAVAWATFVYFDVFEGLEGWLRRREVWELGEPILLPAVLAILLGVLYYWRELGKLRREMAERERVGEVLRRSEAGLVAAQRIARVGNIEYDFRKGEARWSDEAYRIFGYEPRSFVPTYKTFLGSVHPDDKRRLLEAVRGFLYHGRREDVEYRVVRPDGEARCVCTRCEVVYGEVGEPIELVGTVQDVTERVRTEVKLRQAQERYRSLVEHAPLVTFVYVREPEGGTHISYASPQIEALVGYPSESFEDDPEFWISLLHPEDRERVLAETDRTDATGEPFEMEYRLVHRDGRAVWVSEQTVLMGREEDGTTFWRGVYVDITERREAEERLREAETRYRTLVERVPAITYLHVQRPGGQSVTDYISPQIETVLGYTPEECSGDPEFWKTVLHPEDRDRVLAEDKRTGQTGEEFRMDFRAISKSGETVWLREDGRLLRSEDGLHQLWHGVLFDITELKRIEEDLRHRFDFEKIVADTLANFVNLAPEEVDSGIEEALRETGEFAGADRGYVFLSSEDGATIENTHEWCATGIEPQIENLKGIPNEAWPWAMKNFRNGEVNHVPRVADLPAEAAAEREECEAEGIRSFLQIPMFREGLLVGFVGFDSVRAERTWSEDEIMLLKTVGELFTNALERKRAHRALQEAEKKYRSLIENIPAVTYVHPVGDSAALSYMSPQIESMLGYTPEEYISEPGFWIGRLHPDDYDRVMAEDQRSNETLEPFSIEFRLQSREGRYVWVREEGVVVRDEEGQPLFWQGFSWNISDRKEVEEKLRGTEKRYRTLVEQTPIATYRQEVEHNGIISYISPQIQTITGYTPEEYLAEPDLWVRMTHPEDRERVLAEDERTDQTGEPFRVEFRKIAREGRVVWVRDEAVLVRDEEGQPLFWQGVVSDVTDRKVAEKALEESEAKFRTVVEQTPAITYTETVSESGTTSYVSPQVEKILGYRPEEVDAGDPFWGLLHPEDRERVVAEDEHANETGEPYSAEYRMLHRDGRVVWVRNEAVLVSTDEDGTQHWQGVIFDITERKEVEAKLQEAETQYRTLVERMPAVTYVQEIEHIDAAVYVSPQMADLTGYKPEDIYADPDLWYGIVDPEDLERVVAEDHRTDETGEPFEMEYRMVHRDGRVVWVRDEAVLVEDPAAGRPRFWQGVLLDITERKQAEEALRRSEAGLAEAQRMASLGSWEWDTRTGEVYWSAEIYRIHGFEPGSFAPSPRALLEAVHPEDREGVEAEVGGPTGVGEPYDIEYRVVRPDGEVRVVRRRAEVEFGEGVEPVRTFGTLQDVTERKALEERLEYQALHDPLTGLPNRAVFMEHLQQALARADRRAEKTAVLFLDLDNFKYVNDSLGHEAGDGLLVAVAGRLASCVRAGDTLARLGGDEFTMLLEDAPTADEAVRLAERILEELREPIDLKGHLVSATASIGISLNLTGEERAEDLLRDADAAMYRSKEKGKNQHEVFDSNMKGNFLERLGLEADLRRAIERDEFVLHYQPIISLEDNAIVGTEALLRWAHPRRGLVPPEEFIRVAEETELIMPIGRWVLREACRQAKEWWDRHPAEPPLTMSVNLSARQFQTPGLVEDVSRVLFETGLSPRGLLLEITESVAMDDAPSTIEILREFEALGVRMTIDDFGTGHTSLTYLKRFPVDFLKIDRSFIAGFDRDFENQAIVAAVIRLAQDLNMEVIAEGVETPEQLAKLRGMGCDMAQGFYWWRPLPSPMLDALIRAHVPR